MSVNLTDIFRQNSKAFRTGATLVVNQGGTGSSKTWSILQLLYLIAKYDKKSRVISVCSYALPHLKAGPMRDMDIILDSFGENPELLKNRSDNFYKIGNSVIEFFGIEGNMARVHGPRRDILFVNECNRKITYEVFDQMYTRTRECTFLDFNPSQEFWYHEKVKANFEHTYVHSTWKDNQWLSDSEKQRILSKQNKPGFENWWRVYGEGEIGVLEGQIFTNWRYGEFDNTLPYGYGLDFGYSPDPDAMVKTAIDEKRKIIYLDERVYKTGQSTADLKRSVLGGISRAHDLIVADCADPRMIKDLSKTDSRVSSVSVNILPVKKDGTVAEWIKSLMGYELVITESSHNLAKELNNYIWSDKKAGIPVDAFNHLIDAFRYYYMFQKQKINTDIWL